MTLVNPHLQTGGAIHVRRVVLPQTRAATAIEAAQQVHGVAFREPTCGRWLELLASVKQPQAARLAQTELGRDAAQQNRDEVAASHTVERAVVAVEIPKEDLKGRRAPLAHRRLVFARKALHAVNGRAVLVAQVRRVVAALALAQRAPAREMVVVGGGVRHGWSARAHRALGDLLEARPARVAAGRRVAHRPFALGQLVAARVARPSGGRRGRRRRGRRRGRWRLRRRRRRDRCGCLGAASANETATRQPAAHARLEHARGHWLEQSAKVSVRGGAGQRRHVMLAAAAVRRLDQHRAVTPRHTQWQMSADRRYLLQRALLLGIRPGEAAVIPEERALHLEAGEGACATRHSRGVVRARPASVVRLEDEAARPLALWLLVGVTRLAV